MAANTDRVLVGLTIERYKEIEPAVILGLVRLLGLEFVEITKTVFEDVDRIAAKLDGMRCGFHLPIVCEDGWDLSTPAAQDEIDNLIDLINTNRQRLHISHVICHPPEDDGHPSTDPRREEVLLDNLSRLEVPVFLENVPHLTESDYLALYSRARERLGEQLLGMCYDGPHYFLTGADPVAALERHLDEIGCVHLSDCTRDRDAHLPFGRAGALPIDAILQTLKRHDYRGIINLEIRPENFQDVLPTIESYLSVLKLFRPGKYLSTRMRLWFVYPILKRVLA